MRLVCTYLRDRLHWVLLAYANTWLVVLVGGLLLSVRGLSGSTLWREAGYLLLLTTFVLALVLAYDFARWWPFAAQQDRLLRSGAEADALTNLPEGGTLEQQAGAALLRLMHGRFATERARYEEAHQRHLSFIHLWVHQMKTPVSLLSVIAQRDHLDAVEEQAATINEGLDLVLNMARLQEFALDYQVRRVDLAPLVRAVISGRKKQFIRLGIFPQVAVEGELTPVLSDPKWLAFSVDQVVGNALKYGSSGQGFAIVIRAVGREIELAVTDQGPGIPPEDLPRVFEPFFTGENGRRFAGATGVGLYMVKRVMDELGHTVAMESTVGSGTTVRFRFQVTEL